MRTCMLAFCALLVAGSCAASDGGAQTVAPPPSMTAATASTTTAASSPAETTTTTDGAESTTLPPAASTATDDATEGKPDEGSAALGAVDALYAALSVGDVETALSIAHGNDLVSVLPIAVEGLHSTFAHECTLAETPGVIRCTETVVDDLYGPAGISNEAFVRYRYHEGELALATDAEYQPNLPFICEADPRGDALRFLMEFRVWAASNHPELEGSWKWGWPIDSTTAIPCTVYPFSTIEAAREIAGIVPEFVAQSDDWPLDDA